MDGKKRENGQAKERSFSAGEELYKEEWHVAIIGMRHKDLSIFYDLHTWEFGKHPTIPRA